MNKFDANSTAIFAFGVAMLQRNTSSLDQNQALGIAELVSDKLLQLHLTSYKIKCNTIYGQ